MTPLLLEGLLTAVALAWLLCEALWAGCPEDREDVVESIRRMW